jgi:hypothetical protein
MRDSRTFGNDIEDHYRPKANSSYRPILQRQHYPRVYRLTKQEGDLAACYHLR